MSEFRPVTKAQPCAVCAGKDGCSRKDDGLLLCRRRQGEQPGFCHHGPCKKDSQWTQYRAAGDGPSTAVRQGPGQKKPIDWKKLAASYAKALTDQHAKDLAASLGLTWWALDALQVGFHANDSRGACWTFSEVDAAGTVIGISRRYRDGKKLSMQDSARGLTVPHRWQDGDGPLLLVEGPSDVLACAAVGLTAIGRPSNTGGVAHLAALLASLPRGREVMVVGENDRDDTKGIWPGRDGAVKVAGELTEKLGRPVPWVMPPAGSKDVRKWIVSQAADLDDEAVRRDLAGRLVAALRRTADTKATEFPAPIPMSQLRADDQDALWLVDGYFARDAITLLSALWKVGKTTCLAHLLRAVQAGGDFCGLTVRPGKVLYITEESKSIWATRRDKLGLTDATELVVRPFVGKPGRDRWNLFIAEYLSGILADQPADLVVFDTLSNLWPVKDENNAAEVQEALMPLRLISEGRSLLLVHHLRKSDGGEGTASRGSGALPGFVDVLMEMRRLDKQDAQNRRRVLTAWGRYDNTPAELVVELKDGEYVGCGSRDAATFAEAARNILAILPDQLPGMKAAEVFDEWPGESIQKQELYRALAKGFEQGLWQRGGAGKRNDPFLFWKPAL